MGFFEIRLHVRNAEKDATGERLHDSEQEHDGKRTVGRVVQ